MQPHQASRTAEIMAAFRAAESAKPPGQRLFSDPYAAAFAPPGLRLASRLAALPVAGALITQGIDRRWPGARSSAVARTRLIDDWVQEAVAGGIKQVVVLGAGFDSRAWRLEALATAKVFEVDHPATSAAKAARLAALAAPARAVRFVQVDFDRADVATALAAAGFDVGLRSLVLWEGVSQYLGAAAVEAVFAWVGRLPPTSRLIFTYVDAGLLDGSVAFTGAAAVLNAVQKSHERWTWGARPADLPAALRRYHLTLRRDLGAADYRPLVMGAAARRCRGYEFYRVAEAEVVHAEADG